MNSLDSPQSAVVAELAERIVNLSTGGKRRMVAIAGAPASGKSTLAAALTERVNAAGCKARDIPMDGFHLDNRILEMRGLRSRKGAPETFDAEGFIALMRRMKDGGEIFYPLFDRGRDLAVAGAAVIEAECDIAIVEGNYLLFDEDPWRRLAEIWDVSVWIDTPESVVFDRCVQRWLDHGHMLEAARDRAEGNDVRNARRIFEARLGADVIVTEPHESQPE